MAGFGSSFRRISGAALLSAALGAAAPALAQEDVLVPINSLSPSAALELAQASLASCRASGFQVAVAVVDRMGVTQVMLRDRYAGPHTPEASENMAWTAVSFRADTRSLSDRTKYDSEQSGARMIDKTLMIGGGVPIRAGGQIVGGVGISGAPSGEENDRCARAGIESMRAKLELGS